MLKAIKKGLLYAHRIDGKKERNTFMNGFLPVCKQDLIDRGIEQLDFICITGDAYVDHPSFGVAIISRVIEAIGYTVGVIAQPDWKSARDFTKLGKPKYAFMVTSGNVDSMVAHYTSAKKRRSDDAYSPGNIAGKRPDRAVTVYTKKCKELFPDVPVIIGGLEASLRRFAHYDYWDDGVRPSILLESGADMLSYGMGENQTIQICNRLAAGEDIAAMTDIRGTCYLTEPKNTPLGAVQCPDYELVKTDKKSYAKACRIQFDEVDEVRGRMVIQRHGSRMLVQNPPMPALTTEEFDWVYELPYQRAYHPMYEAQGGVPSIKEVEFSIIHNRGCFGNCNFCSIALHQGRKISVRSMDSVVREAEMLTKKPGFKGYIHDVGGPTANFRRNSCDKQEKAGLCKGKKCLAPTPCPALKADHSEYVELLRRLRTIPGIKKVFIRSGIRYDYLMEDPDDTFLKELIAYHVSGQLKVAPEHCSNNVLDKMGKPHIEVYEAFAKRFYDLTKSIGKEQYLVPYLMSSHPGSTLRDAVELSLFLKKNHMHPEQVQDFYPTPGTIATCMFYTGLDPYTMEEVYVPRTPRDKAEQRALLQYFKPENADIVRRALVKCGRRDLIGYGKDCMVPPAPQAPENGFKNRGAASGNNRRSGKKGPIRSVGKNGPHRKKKK